jgi:hypothetical protein
VRLLAEHRTLIGFAEHVDIVEITVCLEVVYMKELGPLLDGFVDDILPFAMTLLLLVS